MEFIELHNVSKVYKNGVTALADVSLNIKKGEFVFLIGHTASGKSTLAKLFYREEKPTKGDVYVGGVNVAKLRNSKVFKLRRKIGIVFQDFKLLPKLTAYENVAFALEMYGLPKEEIRAKTLKALDLVGLKAKLRTYPTELSGGEQQRVGIARAIVNGPPLLIADEPTGNLDPATSMEVMEILNQINQRGITIIVSTHDESIVNHYRKRVLTLDSGEIIKDVEGGTYD